MKNPPITILSFDPGTTCTGWAVCTFKKETAMMSVIKCDNFSPASLAKKNKEDCEKYTQQLIALDSLAAEVENLILTYKPDYVVSEDAFWQMNRLNAYVSLKLNIHTIARVCKNYGLILYKLAPRDVKKVISGSGAASKDTVQDSVINHPDIKFKGNKNTIINKMIEHEADAVAIAKTLCEKILMF